MANVNTQFINYFITQLLNAAKGGFTVNVNDPDEVGQYALAIIGLGADLIPEIGPALGALCNLLGVDALHERIEKLIDYKIAEYHLKILRAKIKGFQNNMQFYSQYLKDFDNAKTKEQKGLAANTLKTQHATFLNIIIADIPQFQVDDYAVPSLPLFSLVATMHLTLLSDGIQRGKDWGYSDDNVETMRNQFKSKTSSSKRSVPGEHKRLQDILLPGSLMEEAIRRGVKAGVPAEVLDAWKDAYAALYKPGRAPDNGDEDLDYPTYAKKICTKRRGQVQLESGSNYQGYRDADNYRSCSDYDTSMVLNVLNYAEVWPFMAGDTWTANAIRNVDREIFYGPYRRWAGGASWDTSNPPPITNRGDNITSIIVRGWDDIDGLQVKHGSSWDRFQGNDSGGIRKQIDMIYDEYVNSVSITDGFKLGKLTFKTNYGNTVSNGSAAHATTLDVVDPPGYGLTSVIITQWSGDSPTGCDGVILGFRPLITDASRMD